MMYDDSSGFDPLDPEPEGTGRGARRRSWLRVIVGLGLTVIGAWLTVDWRMQRYRSYPWDFSDEPFPAIFAAGLGLCILIFEWMWAPAPDDAEPPPKD